MPQPTFSPEDLLAAASVDDAVLELCPDYRALLLVVELFQLCLRRRCVAWRRCAQLSGSLFGQRLRRRKR